MGVELVHGRGEILLKQEPCVGIAGCVAEKIEVQGNGFLAGREKSSRPREMLRNRRRGVGVRVGKSLSFGIRMRFESRFCQIRAR